MNIYVIIIQHIIHCGSRKVINRRIMRKNKNGKIILKGGPWTSSLKSEIKKINYSQSLKF